MSTLITIIILITALLLIGVILIQNSKGGGLSSEFGNTNQIMGVRKTTDFLEKATWTLGIVLCVLSLISNSFNEPENTAGTPNSELQEFIENEAPVIPPPANAPVQQPLPAE